MFSKRSFLALLGLAPMAALANQSPIADTSKSFPVSLAGVALSYVYGRFEVRVECMSTLEVATNTFTFTANDIAAGAISAAKLAAGACRQPGHKVSLLIDGKVIHQSRCCGRVYITCHHELDPGVWYLVNYTSDGGVIKDFSLTRVDR